MHPRVKPRTPAAHIFIQLASPTIPATWKQYLPSPKPPDAPADGRQRTASRERGRSHRTPGAGALTCAASPNVTAEEPGDTRPHALPRAR